MSTKNYLIVSGVAGGATTAARLRRSDEQAEIMMFERENTFRSLIADYHIHIGEQFRKGKAFSSNSCGNVDKIQFPTFGTWVRYPKLIVIRKTVEVKNCYKPVRFMKKGMTSSFYHLELVH